MLALILLIFAFVLAVIQAWFGRSAQPYVVPHLGWLALALYLLTLILQGWH